MQTLTLVNNLHKNQTQSDVGGVYDLKVKGLTSVHVGHKSNSKKAKNSYGVLALVVCIHIVAVLALINAKATQPIIKDLQTPMMVSLLTSPAPEPEVVPLIPKPPQRVIKQQNLLLNSKNKRPSQLLLHKKSCSLWLLKRHLRPPRQ